MEYKTLKLSTENSVTTITLNRPEKRNALSAQLVEELLAAFDEIEKSSAQVLILTGSGKAFCAGMDLDGLKSLVDKTEEENVHDSERASRICSAECMTFPLPTIAAVNGAAIAGGTAMATMCDFTLAVPERQVRLHGSADRIRSRDCVFVSGLASGTQDRPRPAAERPHLRRG